MRCIVGNVLDAVNEDGLRLDGMFRLKLVADPRLSPDTRYVAYLRKHLDRDTDGAVEEIIVADLRDGSEGRPAPDGYGRPPAPLVSGRAARVPQRGERDQPGVALVARRPGRAPAQQDRRSGLRSGLVAGRTSDRGDPRLAGNTRRTARRRGGPRAVAARRAGRA